MTFTLYDNVQDFLADVADTLRKHYIQNNLLIHNAKDGPDKVMASVKDANGGILVAAIRTEPFPLVMYEKDNVPNDKAVEVLAQGFAQNGIEIDFFATVPGLAERFRDAYSAVTGFTFENQKNLTLYKTDRTDPLMKDVPGTLRRADERDMFFLPYWVADFQPACKLGPYVLEPSVGKTKIIVERGDLFIWEDGGPVSMAAKVRETGPCRFIGEVYTPPHLRGKGYSYACVWHLTQKLFADGYEYAALYADNANPYSNKVYQKIGYKKVIEHHEYKKVGG